MYSTEEILVRVHKMLCSGNFEHWYPDVFIEYICGDGKSKDEVMADLKKFLDLK